MSDGGIETARNLLGLTTQLMRRFAAEMRRSGARLSPMQIGMLSRIGEGPCSLTDLSQHQAVRPPTASQSVAVLVERGWVDRRHPADDRRRTQFRLTPTGRRALNSMKRQAERFVASLVDSLSPKEQREINAALVRLRQAVEQGKEST